MKAVSIHQAKTQLSSLLAEVERTGEEIVICRRKTPVATLAPFRKRSRLEPHPLMKEVSIDYDPTEPMSADEWPPEEEG